MSWHRPGPAMGIMMWMVIIIGGSTDVRIQTQVTPQRSLEIPVLFTPDKLVHHSCVVVLKSVMSDSLQGLEWRYPLQPSRVPDRIILNLHHRAHLSAYLLVPSRLALPACCITAGRNLTKQPEDCISCA